MSLLKRKKNKRNTHPDFWVIGASVTGPTHQRKHMPNQDAYSITAKQKTRVLCVADGHGSSTCFRSHIGAKIAVDLSSVTYPYEDMQKSLDQPDSFFDHLARLWAQKHLKQWVTSVMTHLREHPFTQEEVDNLDGKGRKELGRNALLAYGSTVIAVAIHEHRIVGYNLGDGDLLVYKQGQPLDVRHRDDALLGNATYSLAVPGSLSKLAVVNESTSDVELLLLATDGYRNSYRVESGFLKVGNDFMTLYKSHGAKLIEDHLETWFQETTEGGSGDDLTAILAFCDKQ